MIERNGRPRKAKDQGNMHHDACACGNCAHLCVQTEAHMFLYIWHYHIHVVVRTIQILTCRSTLGSKGIDVNTCSGFP